MGSDPLVLTASRRHNASQSLFRPPLPVANGDGGGDEKERTWPHNYRTPALACLTTRNPASQLARQDNAGMAPSTHHHLPPLFPRSLASLLDPVHHSPPPPASFHYNTRLPSEEFRAVFADRPNNVVVKVKFKKHQEIKMVRGGTGVACIGNSHHQAYALSEFNTSKIRERMSETLLLMGVSRSEILEHSERVKT
ncbi:hypothetical protein Sjap_024330 [Stephania japonica]|uniref:Uncharacterized protein n=1 Tax=Stephania japonica TaxID=461633 RepID=A0AAP0HJR9_9MAGN